MEPRPIFVSRPSAQIISASLIKTSRDLNFGINPEIAVTSTTARAAVVA